MLKIIGVSLSMFAAVAIQAEPPKARTASKGSQPIKVTISPELEEGAVAKTRLNGTPVTAARLNNTSPFAKIVLGSVRSFQDVQDEQQSQRDNRQVGKGSFVTSATQRTSTQQPQTFLITDQGVHRAQFTPATETKNLPDVGTIQNRPSVVRPQTQIPHQLQDGGAWVAVPTVEGENAIVAGQDAFAAEQAAIARRRSDPLILDLEGDGLRLIGPSKGRRFDVNGDGTAEYTGWACGSDDGFLALDRNNNGMIDNGNELFGLNNNNSAAGNGFEVLKPFDENKDGVIDQKDSVYTKLLVWRDGNCNAVSERQELEPLTSLGIVSIDLNFDKHNLVVDSANNQLKELSTFNRQRKNAYGGIEEVPLNVVNVWFANFVIP